MKIEALKIKEPYEVGGNVNNATIILVGEEHGIDWIIDKEFEIWYNCYHTEGLRHLFIESPYYDAQFYNLWLKSDNDEMYETLFLDKKGTAAYNQYSYEFYKKMKQECPETIFHGTDIGHQYDTTGKRFLEYLIAHNFRNSEQYKLTIKAINQGKKYYVNHSPQYRENTMTKNFIDEFDKLKHEKIIGIYGGAHINYNKSAFYGNYPCMAKQLREYYGDIIYFENYKK
ncbi:MAG: hypothetical protein LBK43_05370 [Treponema sp.]|nr:hypothetical protein [Treponema sp.]